MAGCHFARNGADKLQKGLRLRFLESHSLENISLKNNQNKNLNSEEVTVLEYVVSWQCDLHWGQSLVASPM